MDSVKGEVGTQTAGKMVLKPLGTKYVPEAHWYIDDERFKCSGLVLSYHGSQLIPYATLETRLRTMLLMWKDTAPSETALLLLVG